MGCVVPIMHGESLLTSSEIEGENVTRLKCVSKNRFVSGHDSIPQVGGIYFGYWLLQSVLIYVNQWRKGFVLGFGFALVLIFNFGNFGSYGNGVVRVYSR